MWGTDSTWYGSPQPLIDAFRAFHIPPRFQEQYGYPELTAADKERILSSNAQALYGVSSDALQAADRDRDRSWVTNASTELTRAIESAGSGTGR